MYDIQPLAYTVLPHAVLVVFAVKIFFYFHNLIRICQMGTLRGLFLNQLLVYFKNDVNVSQMFYSLLYCVVQKTVMCSKWLNESACEPCCIFRFMAEFCHNTNSEALTLYFYV